MPEMKHGFKGPGPHCYLCGNLRESSLHLTNGEKHQFKHSSVGGRYCYECGLMDTDNIHNVENPVNQEPLKPHDFEGASDSCGRCGHSKDQFIHNVTIDPNHNFAGGGPYCLLCGKGYALHNQYRTMNDGGKILHRDLNPHTYTGGPDERDCCTICGCVKNGNIAHMAQIISQEPLKPHYFEGTGDSCVQCGHAKDQIPPHIAEPTTIYWCKACRVPYNFHPAAQLNICPVCKGALITIPLKLKESMPADEVNAITQVAWEAVQPMAMTYFKRIVKAVIRELGE